MSSGAEFIRKPVDAAEAGAQAFGSSPVEHAANPPISAVALPSRRRSVPAGETSITAVSLPRSRRASEGRRLKLVPSEPTDPQPVQPGEEGKVIASIRTVSEARVSSLDAESQITLWKRLSQEGEQVTDAERLSDKERTELTLKVARLDPAFIKARDALVAEALGVADKVARHFRNSALPHDQLQNVARLGIIEAAERYKLEHEGVEVPFSHLASVSARGKILHELENFQPVRSRRVRDAGRAAMRVEDDLTARLQRTPTRKEVQDELDARGAGLSSDTVRAGRYGIVVHSYDNQGDGSLPPEYFDIVTADADVDVEGQTVDGVFMEGMSTQLSVALGTLDQRSQALIGDLFFRDDTTQADIARRLGLSKTHVGRLRAEALSRLRASLEGGKVLPQRDGREEERAAVEAEAARHEGRWLGTVGDVSFGEAIRLLRLEQGLSRRSFSRASGVGRTSLERAENGGDITMYPLNNIITASSLEGDGKAAQQLRLASAGIEPLTDRKISHTQIGSLVRYFRVGKGLGQEEFAKLLFMSGSNVNFIENHGRVPHGLDTTLIQGLDLEPAMQKVVRRLATGEGRIGSRTLQALADEKILIQPADQAKSRSRDEVAEAIDAATTMGDAFDVLVASELVNADELNGALKAMFAKYHTGRSLIDRMRRGELVPYETSVVGAMKGLGFSIHHPATHAMLRRISPKA